MRIPVRSLFLSDFHLGKPSASVECLAKFLDQIEPQQIYLVGDIIDMHYLRRCATFPTSHTGILLDLLRRAEAGTPTTYLTGNHDDCLRRSESLRYGPVKVVEELVHMTADGRRFLVIHGDQFDIVLQKAPWLGPVGDRFYECAARIDRAIGHIAPKGPAPGRRRSALSAYCKHLVKLTVNGLGRTEKAMADLLQSKGLDGIIYGHTHHAALQTSGGYVYANAGDWVDSRTALIEQFDGKLEIWSSEDTAITRIFSEETVRRSQAS